MPGAARIACVVALPRDPRGQHSVVRVSAQQGRPVEPVGAGKARAGDGLWGGRGALKWWLGRRPDCRG